MMMIVINNDNNFFNKNLFNFPKNIKYSDMEDDNDNDNEIEDNRIENKIMEF